MTAAGRRLWSDPTGIMLVAGVLAIVPLLLAPWGPRRMIRRTPADPHPGAPLVPYPLPGWVAIVILASGGVAWAGFSAAVLDEPMGPLQLAGASTLATFAGGLAWGERRAGRVLVRIDARAPHGGGLRGYVSSRLWLGTVVTRKGGARP